MAAATLGCPTTRTEAAAQTGDRPMPAERPRALDLLLLDGVAPGTRRAVVEEVVREVAPGADSVGVDLISDLPWPQEARAALTAIAEATGAREGETAVGLDLAEARKRAWFAALVPHTIAAEIWGPAGSDVSFAASDTGSVIGWTLPAERWNRVRARLRSRGIDADSATRPAP
ncbi:hypothetical protein [Kitasatospora cinereorecta]|uniref:Uncharacterized protein n=1 Tax=Kitasatospora cinereorecta TaxID=285560 RepID=A0ABW0VGY6_9ACTN